MKSILGGLIFTHILLLLVAGERNINSPEISSKQGDKAVMLGRYDEALSLYTDAVNGDSENPIYFMKRCAIYIQKGRLKEALSDVNRVISLSPKRVTAYQRRSKILFMMGKLDRANDDIQMGLGIQSNNKEILQLQKEIIPIRILFNEALEQFKRKNYDFCMEKLDRVIESSNYWEEALMMHASCALEVGKYEVVLEDTAQLLRISWKNQDALFLRGMALMYLDTENMDTIKGYWSKCLELDQGNEKCKSAQISYVRFESDYENAMRAIEDKNWKSAMELLNLCLNYDTKWDAMHLKIYKHMITVYLGLGDGENALMFCDKYIGKNGKDAQIFILKSESYILLEEWDLAIREVDNAININGGITQETLNQKSKIEKLKRIATRKDYYKILNISKTATKKEITKAYRRLSIIYHPDKNPEKSSISIYRDIVEAYEILLDDNKRNSYDNGDDISQNHHQQQQQNEVRFQGFTFHWNN